ncbi:NLRC3 [Symbiodinium sp. CCMP2592]|nr:NLRC3 [Symbiodinium sp. CCMP2592]
MPKLFVERDYVDQELAKLRREMSDLKAELLSKLDEQFGNQNPNWNDPMPSKRQLEEEVGISISGSEQSIPVEGSGKDKKGASALVSEEPGDEKDPSEQIVCFDRKSAWSIPLVLSWSHVTDSIFACLLLLLNASMQILFIVILLSPEFLGEDFSEQLESAKEWRRSFAHDYLYVDLAEKSLATKVCDEDGSLIFSTAQVALVGEINSYLALSKFGEEAFQLPSFQPGVLLSVLCILLWNICVFKELRSIWYVLKGILLGSAWSKARLSQSNSVQELWQLSWQRGFVMSCVCLGRICVACALLISGCIWLGHTTSITELMLNSVALESVLHVDEFIFSALVPTNLQQKIQILQPVKIKKSRRSPRLENVVLFSVLSAALVLPYLLILAPLRETMLQVKYELCGGQQQFAMGFKDGIVREFATQPAESNITANRYIERAVQEKVFPEDFPVKLAAPAVEPDISRMRSMLNQEYVDWKREYAECPPDSDGSSMADFLAAAAFEVGHTGNRSCEALKTYCSDSDNFDFDTSMRLYSTAATWLRFACPRACGCTDPNSSPVFRTPRHGCRRSCIQQRYGFSMFSGSPSFGRLPSFPAACKDTPPGRAWRHFWGNAAFMSAAHLNSAVAYESESFRSLVGAAMEVGCPILTVAPTDYGGNLVCRGTIYNLPLAWWCPETCGCASSGNAERDRFCFGYDYCPMHVLETDTNAAWEFIRKYDILKILMNPELIPYSL